MSYDPIKKDTEEVLKRKKQAECPHTMWVKRCSLCGLILDNEHSHEDIPIKEIFIIDEPKTK